MLVWWCFLTLAFLAGWIFCAILTGNLRDEVRILRRDYEALKDTHGALLRERAILQSRLAAHKNELVDRALELPLKLEMAARIGAQKVLKKGT